MRNYLCAYFLQPPENMSSELYQGSGNIVPCDYPPSNSAWCYLDRESTSENKNRTQWIQLESHNVHTFRINIREHFSAVRREEVLDNFESSQINKYIVFGGPKRLVNFLYRTMSIQSGLGILNVSRQCSYTESDFESDKFNIGLSTILAKHMCTRHSLLPTADDSNSEENHKPPYQWPFEKFATKQLHAGVP